MREDRADPWMTGDPTLAPGTPSDSAGDFFDTVLSCNKTFLNRGVRDDHFINTPIYYSIQQTMWFNHVNMEENLRGRFPTSPGIHVMKKLKQFQEQREVRDTTYTLCRGGKVIADWIVLTGNDFLTEWSDTFINSSQLPHGGWWMTAIQNTHVTPICGYVWATGAFW